MPPESRVRMAELQLETLQLETIRKLPKVLLHDHLDGSLRPRTIIELAEKTGETLPAYDTEELESWFHRGAHRGSLPLYLEGFAVTTAVMQTEEALQRTARERVEDLIEDGVVYAEIRFAPVLHLKKSLNLEQVVLSVLKGLDEGCYEKSIDCRLIICAMRDMTGEASLEMAELAANFRDRGVVGFDLAGDESGHPAKRHLEA
ncbi:MAG: adenosine deaminase, partial [Planctomycetota bacterium]